MEVENKQDGILLKMQCKKCPILALAAATDADLRCPSACGGYRGRARDKVRMRDAMRPPRIRRTPQRPPPSPPLAATP
jgi:hypothetical protein